MRKLHVFCFILLFVLGLASSAQAVLINAGGSMIYEFDFSSDAISKPYDGYEATVYMDLFYDPVPPSNGINFSIFDAGHRYAIGPIINWNMNFTNHVVSTVGDGFPITDDLVYLQFDVTGGSVDFHSANLRMSIFHTSPDGNYKDWTQTLRGTKPVPEPATMLLLGAGLASLGVFRKKFNKA